MNTNELSQLELEQVQASLERLHQELSKVIVGQDALLRRLIMALLADGHVLVEGVPGLAKTTAIKTLAQALDMDFQRIQFTPDLLPADVVGTSIYNPKSGDFHVKKGPLFTHILLADEINRAPAKVQSALLEAMQERQVTIAEHTFMLAQPFLVMATQNPIEQEGTYPLPEAQLDRFLFKLRIDYPDLESEKQILDRCADKSPAINAVMSIEQLMRLRAQVENIYVDERVKDYLVKLVHATRDPQASGMDLDQMIAFGASPRGSICLHRAARVHAMMQARSYVTPQDVKDIAHDVLRHRLLLTYEAQAEGYSSDDIVQKILDNVEVP